MATIHNLGVQAGYGSHRANKWPETAYLLWIGHSTIGKWAMAFSKEAKVALPDAELLRENEQLRKENRFLRV